MNDNAGTLILAGALLAGGIALGRAVATEVEARRSESEFEEFEEQHYRAAGFSRESEQPVSVAEDLGALFAALVGMGLMIASTPQMIDELKQLGK